MDRRIVSAAIVLLFISAVAVLVQLNTPAAKSITPTLTNKPEVCLTCHDGIEEISPSHPVQTFRMRDLSWRQRPRPRQEPRSFRPAR
jgi:hypothetical protein